MKAKDFFKSFSEAIDPNAEIVFVTEDGTVLKPLYPGELYMGRVEEKYVGKIGDELMNDMAATVVCETIGKIIR